MTTIDTDLAEALRSADNKFQRAALAVVFADREEFIASGRYPYNDEVARWIGEKHGIPVLPHHGAPGWGKDGDLTAQLHHEIYLASQQHAALKLVAQEETLAAQGYRPITELVPVAGKKIELADGVTYRIIACPDTLDYALLAPRKRNIGLSLRAMCQQHEAYALAKQEGWTRGNDPRVRMFKEAS